MGNDDQTGALLGDKTTGGAASQMQSVQNRTTTTSKYEATENTKNEAPSKMEGAKKDAPSQVQGANDEEPPFVRGDVPLDKPPPKTTLTVKNKVATFRCDGSGKPVYFDLEIVNDAWDEYVFRMKCTYGSSWFRADPHIGQIAFDSKTKVRLWYANKKRHPAKGDVAPTPYFTIAYGPTCNLVEDFDDFEDDEDADVDTIADKAWQRTQEKKRKKRIPKESPEGLRITEMDAMEDHFNQWKQFSGIQDQIRIDMEFVIVKKKETQNLKK